MVNANQSNFESQPLSSYSNLSQLDATQNQEIHSKQLNGRSIAIPIAPKLQEMSEKATHLYEAIQDLHQLEEVPFNIIAKTVHSDEIENSLGEDKIQQFAAKMSEGFKKEKLGAEAVFSLTEDAEADAEAKILVGQIHATLNTFGFAYHSRYQLETDVFAFNKNIKGLLKSFDLEKATPAAKEEKVKQIDQFHDEFIDQIIKENKIHKMGFNGEHIPLTTEEAELIKIEIKIILREHTYNNFPELRMLETQEKKPAENTEEKTTEEKIHTAVVINSNSVRSTEGAEFKNVKNVELVAHSIIDDIINDIIAKDKEKRAEDKKEQQLLDLIDRIKSDAIKEEILNREILKSEAGLQEFKGRLNKYTEAPIEELVKINQVYSKAENEKVGNGKVRMRLPGIHKMKPLTAAAAA